MGGCGCRFALESIAKDGIVTRARPALSVVFDAAAAKLCSYCFRLAAGVPCQACQRFATCADCAQHANWHGFECAPFMALPPKARQGRDTSTIRMLLRYKATAEHGEWCGEAAVCGKESFPLLETLQAIDTTSNRLPVIRQLAAVTGVSGLARLSGICGQCGGQRPI